MKEIAAVSRLDHAFSNWTADGFRRWSYLPPGLPSPFVLSEPQYIGVQKATAEQTIITATDGAPLELWIAHEGAIPEKVTEDLRHRNPWTQTTEDIPWIGEVKFMEIKLRPGNTVILPRHWWYAVRVAEEKGSAWYWTAQFHTPISQLVSLVQRSI
jgi:hypothetical protein